jgi:hypothetical protein
MADRRLLNISVGMNFGLNIGGAFCIPSAPYGHWISGNRICLDKESTSPPSLEPERRASTIFICQQCPNSVVKPTGGLHYLRKKGTAGCNEVALAELVAACEGN